MTLGLDFAEIISIFPCSLDGVVIRTGLETTVAIRAQAGRKQHKRPSTLRSSAPGLVSGHVPSFHLQGSGLVARQHLLEL